MDVNWIIEGLDQLSGADHPADVPRVRARVLRNLTGMSWETYANFARFGFIAVIVAIQIPQVRQALNFAVNGTLLLLATIFGLA